MDPSDPVQKTFDADRLRDEFLISSPVRDCLDDFHGRQRVFRTGCNELGHSLHEILQKYSKTWCGPFFRLHQTRVKGTLSICKKIFRSLLAISGGDPSETTTDGALIQQHYSGIRDFVGGRLCIGFSADYLGAVKVVQAELKLRGIPTDTSLPERDYFAKPNRGYRAYHFFVRILTQPEPNNLAEVQIRSLVGHAWAEGFHDTLYKPFRDIPGGVPKEIELHADAITGSLATADDALNRLRDSVRQLHSGRCGGWVA